MDKRLYEYMRKQWCRDAWVVDLRTNKGEGMFEKMASKVFKKELDDLKKMYETMLEEKRPDERDMLKYLVYQMRNYIRCYDRISDAEHGLKELKKKMEMYEEEQENG